MMAEAAAFLAERRDQASRDVAAALGEKGIDWSGDESAETGAREPANPAPAVRVEWNADARVLRAGGEEAVELRVTNQGSRTLHRVLAVLDSEIGFLRGPAALVGRIEPGETVARSISIKPPVELRLARLPVQVLLEDDAGALGRHGPYWLVVDEDLPAPPGM